MYEWSFLVCTPFPSSTATVLSLVSCTHKHESLYPDSHWSSERVSGGKQVSGSPGIQERAGLLSLPCKLLSPVKFLSLFLVDFIYPFPYTSFYFYFYFILLYSTVLVLPYIDMNPPWVSIYFCNYFGSMLFLWQSSFLHTWLQGRVLEE